MKIKIQKLDEPNLNGRTYTKDTFSKSLGRTVLGDLDGSIVDLGGVSHQVENLRIEDGFLVGDLVVLSTPQGKILDQILENLSAEANFRTCGYGNVDDFGVVTDFEIVSVSLVNDPA